MADNGVTGYVVGDQLDGPPPKTPAEALAQQQASRGRARILEVYKADGVTVVGTFTVTGGSGTKPVLPDKK